MLPFFRRYQRYFFLFIAIIVIASFVFFGTFSTAGNEAVVREERILGAMIDGSPLRLSEVRALSRFIASDREDRVHRSGQLPNLCNDGVVRRDLLQNGIADLLAAAYFEQLQGDLTPRIEKAKKFHPYVHPLVSTISAEAIWQRFAPELQQEMQRLQQEICDTTHTFGQLARLYQRQNDLPPAALRRILDFQQKQLGVSRIDQRLQEGADETLALFGFHTLSDWFGTSFLDLSAEFILNAAALAESKGYHVTLEEAKGDLLRNFQVSVQQANNSSLAGISLQKHLHALGFDEKEATAAWRKVLLFRRYFQGVSQASFQDRLPFKGFDAYAHKTAHITLYHWSEALRLKNLQDITDLQAYLHAVAPRLPDPLAIPVVFYSPEEVKKQYPELVASVCQAKIQEISLVDVALRAPIKEVWEWQLRDLNWDSLRKAFASLPNAQSRAERFAGLEKLSSALRVQIDSFSRLQMVASHPEWIEEALGAAPQREETLVLSQGKASLQSILDPARFCALCESALQGDVLAREALLCYSDGGKTLYRVEAEKWVQPEHILTFAEAKELGVLESVVDRYLREIEPEKSVSREEVSRRALAEVFQALAKRAEKPPSQWSDALYATHRMQQLASAALASLKKNPDDPYWLGMQGGALQLQFALEKLEIAVQRTETRDFRFREDEMKNKLFCMHPHEWSEVYTPPNGDVFFFYLTKTDTAETPVFDRLSVGKQLVAADAQRYLAERLLKQILDKRAIIIPVQRDS